MADDRPGAPGPGDDAGRRRRGLRTGFTTGTCAAAAAKAAATGLATGTVPATVEVGLPSGRRVSFPVEGAGPVPDGAPATAAVVKDAGDDPDCTDGAHLTAQVSWLEDGPETVLAGGDGVGTVTKPGLGLPVGGPAINPVPRRMILASLSEVPGVRGDPERERPGDRAVRVVVSVPGGRQMATKTTNARLGIVGGISILGTSGIVRPFSTASYRASVVQQVKVAAAQGERHLYLCTGSRSERAVRSLDPRVDPVCVVEVGDFMGIALRQGAAAGVAEVDVVAMAGKIAKYAAGVMMTHFHRSHVDTALLEEIAREVGAPDRVVEAATRTATARHFYEACVAAGSLAPLTRMCELARDHCRAHVGGKLVVHVTMVDFEGREVTARA